MFSPYLLAAFDAARRAQELRDETDRERSARAARTATARRPSLRGLLRRRDDRARPSAPFIPEVRDYPFGVAAR